MQQPVRPLNDEHSLVELIQHVGDDKMIVNAARVSFGGDNDVPLNAADAKLIKYLLEHHHGSPFEHNLITFKIISPVYIDRQMVRHRVGVSKNEKSGRYVKMEDHVYIPKLFRQQATNNRQASVEATSDFNHAKANLILRNAWKSAYQSYEDLLAMGVTREQARGVLPLSLYVESYYTFNLRSLLHFIELRDHPGAQWEIQQYAKAMVDIIRPLFPVALSAWEEINQSDS